MKEDRQRGERRWKRVLSKKGRKVRERAKIMVELSRTSGRTASPHRLFVGVRPVQGSGREEELWVSQKKNEVKGGRERRD